MGYGSAGGRIPELDPVDVGRGQQAAVGAEVEGVWAPIVGPGCAVAHHAVVQRTTLAAIDQLPDPDVVATFPQHHPPIVTAKSPRRAEAMCDFRARFIKSTARKHCRAARFWPALSLDQPILVRSFEGQPLILNDVFIRSSMPAS